MTGSDESDPFGDRSTTEYSVTLSDEFVVRLREQYPSALTVADAIRAAAAEGVRKNEESISEQALRDAFREALDAGPLVVRHVDDEEE